LLKDTFIKSKESLLTNLYILYNIDIDCASNLRHRHFVLMLDDII